jgi:plasmid stability protein
MITVPDVDETLLVRLEDRAKQHGRTLEAEVKSILEAAASPLDPVWERINQARERLAATGRVFSDSTELLREDRDR